MTREIDGSLGRPDGETLAWRRIPGVGPTVVWLGGFRSDMSGTKAQVLADWAQDAGRDYLRFDYFAHGLSSGDFAKGTITRWREDALAVLDELTQGPVVLVGSSMGGWISCLAAMADPARDGVWLQPSDYGDPLPITAAFLEDGARWSILPGPVPIRCPVRVLQGGEDPDVPWTHALELANSLESQDVVFSLIKDGDHRLSRPQDLQRLVRAVEEVA